jgi:hypothetical protein
MSAATWLLVSLEVTHVDAGSEASNVFLGICPAHSCTADDETFASLLGWQFVYLP